MKIELSDYLTIAEAREAVGCSLRGLYRIIDRVEAEGHAPRQTLFGRVVIPRAMLQLLKDNYFPYYSEAHQKKVKTWGQKGGSTKRANAVARAKAAGVEYPFEKGPTCLDVEPTKPKVKRPRGRPRKAAGQPAATYPRVGSGTAGKAT